MDGRDCVAALHRLPCPSRTPRGTDCCCRMRECCLPRGRSWVGAGKRSLDAARRMQRVDKVRMRGSLTPWLRRSCRRRRGSSRRSQCRGQSRRWRWWRRIAWYAWRARSAAGQVEAGTRQGRARSVGERLSRCWLRRMDGWMVATIRGKSAQQDEGVCSGRPCWNKGRLNVSPKSGCSTLGASFRDDSARLARFKWVSARLVSPRLCRRMLTTRVAMP